MPKTGTEESILAALETLAPAHDVSIVDVEVVGATKAPCVRVRIDHADESLPVIGLDEVTAQTAWVSDAIDELDPFPAAFSLEVSSPGLDRPLRRAHDFERFAGQTVVLSTTATEGRRKFTGALQGLSEDGSSVVLLCEGDAEPVSIPLDQVKKCNIKPDFSASSKPSKN